MQKIILSLILFSFLASCDCDDTVECQGLSAAASQIADNSITENKFTNGTDSTLFFSQTKFSKTSRSVIDCDRAMFGGCICDDNGCPEKVAIRQYRFSNPITFPDSFLRTRSFNVLNPDSTYSTKDTSYHIYYTASHNRYQLGIMDSVFSSPAYLFIRFLDTGFSLDFNLVNNKLIPNISNQMQSVSVLANFSTPYKNYTEVYEFIELYDFGTKKSTLFNKIYLSIEHRVIAFESKQNELFYLTD
jgi:hypothetical protein